MNKELVSIEDKQEPIKRGIYRGESRFYKEKILEDTEE